MAAPLPVHGLHHITAIAGPAQENLDFYCGILGMRLVKRSINQDDPGTYHLFYADAEGHPGTDLTFFPWAHMAPPRLGYGLAVEVGLEIPAGSLSWWGTRLDKYGFTVGSMESRFGDRVLPVADPHGMRLGLTERASAGTRPFSPWEESRVPVERQVRGLYGARIWERDAASTGSFLTQTLGFRLLGRENGWSRYGFADAPGAVDVKEMAETRRGAWGVGAVHHLAWAVRDDSEQLAMRKQIEASGARATDVIDRFWFKSVYFKEPGGVLFEIATEGPGFAVDEDRAHLGESLVLPPWFESARGEIERVLPPLVLPHQG
ncbi:MAG TPA: ring-cleaving dioxygenase [Vicinamibacterales bacterium]